MTKWFFAVFGVLTLAAGYLTAYDVGVMEPSITKHSVRQGSVHPGLRAARYGRGK